MPVDYGRWVSRTWDIFSRYRVLWLLGLVAALISGVGGIFQTVAQSASPTLNFDGSLDSNYINYVFDIACFGIIVTALLSFVGAIAQAASIQATDEIARTGEAPTFAVAWSRGVPKMVPLGLFNLVLTAALLLLVAILIGPSILIGGPALVTLYQNALTLGALSGSANEATGALSLACLCFCGGVLILIPVFIIYYMISQLGSRALVLENRNLSAAVSAGWQMFRANLGKSLIGFLIWFVLLVVVSIVTSVILAPFSAVLGLSAARSSSFTGTIPTGSLFALGVLSWLIGAAVGTFTTAFTSVFWTVLYRNLRGMPNSDLAPVGVAPAPGGPAYGSPYGAPPPYTPPGGTPTQAMPPYPPPAGAPPPYPPPYTPPAGSPPYTPPAGGPPPYTPPAGDPPPYTPPPDAPPAYTLPTEGPPPSIPPAEGPPPYTPPAGGPAYSPPADTGGVQYGSPYSPPPTTPEEPPAPEMPDDRARGPESGSGPSA